MSAGDNIKILLFAEDRSANTLAWVSSLEEQGAEVRTLSARASSSHGNVIAVGYNLIPPRIKFLIGEFLVSRLVENEKPDIIIGYRITSYGYLASRTAVRPLVLAAQNEQIIRLPRMFFWFKPILALCVRYALKKADMIHAWGENIKKGLIAYGASPEKILVMHRGIALDIFKPMERKVFSLTDSPVLISTRSLYPDYNIDLLIRAFAIFLKEYPGAILKIVGDGPERGKLSSLACKLGIRDRIVFYKYLDSEFIAEQLRSADIYVSLIRTEGISSSLIEACACGLLPLVADIPASREIVKNGENGILLSSKDPSDVAHAMIAANENMELRKKAFEANPALARDRFDARKNSAAFLDAYRRLIAAKLAVSLSPVSVN